MAEGSAGQAPKPSRRRLPPAKKSARTEPQQEGFVVTDPFDPRGAPSSTGGWSEEMVSLDDAVVAPTDGRGMVQIGGVFAADGSFCRHAAVWRRGKSMLLPPPQAPEPVATLQGRWMWGGVLLNHFGHYLTESTTRFWALPDLADRIDGIVFLHKRNLEATEFNTKFLSLLGYHLPIRVIAQPTHIEHLDVPGQGFGIGEISRGTARFRALFQAHFAPEIAAEGPEKLYVSRSALGLGKGGLVGEGFLEQALAAEGYEIFHPQHHSLEVQIARYRAARLIVAPDGSALHLAAFCCNPGQRVAIIRRRSSPIRQITAHLESFTGVEPETINALQADWVVRDRGGADRFSLGELDITALGQKLQTLGFVQKGEGWPSINDKWRRGEFRRLKEQSGIDYVRVPTGRKARRRAKNEAAK